MADSRRSNCGSCAQMLLTSISLVECHVRLGFAESVARPFQDRPSLAAAARACAPADFHTALRPHKLRREICCAMQGIMPPSTIRGESNPFEMSFAAKDEKCASKRATRTCCPTYLFTAIPLLPYCPSIRKKCQQQEPCTNSKKRTLLTTS